MRRGALLAIVPMLLACSAGGIGGYPGSWSPKWRWFERQPHAALLDGAWTRAREMYNLSPTPTETYLGADWRRGYVTAEVDLLPLLRPVTDGECALALLDLYQTVVTADPGLTAIRRAVPLVYDPASPSYCEHYGPVEAASWAIGTAPEIEARSDCVIVRRPVWRPLRRGEEEGARGAVVACAEPDESMLGSLVPGVVEWVEDTLTREGRLRRRVLRLLESGPAARRHGPAPLM